MLIVALHAKKIKKYIALGFVAVVAVVLLIYFVFSSGAAAVSTENKELPIYSVERTDKKAAITFDCAWGADDIPSILETLKENNIKATFFIVGQWAEKYPDIVSRISREGHDIANHGYSHLRMGAIQGSKIMSEIEKCGEVLSKITGKKVDLFRPPYGDYSNNVINISNNIGYYPIQWDVDSLDWKPDIGKAEIMERVKRKIQCGSIILFHNDTIYTAKILPDIIKECKKDGFEFVPVSELILKSNYYIDFEGRQRPKE